MIIEPSALVRLLSFASPAFPTGGFAYSQGLEFAVEAGDVTDEASLLDWLCHVLRYGAGRADAILLRHAHRARDDAGALAEIAELAAAACMGAERQAETLAVGTAFAASAAAWGAIEAAAYPAVFGLLAGRQGVGEDAACLAFLLSWCGNAVSATIRLGVLGQQAGLRVLAALEPAILAVADDTRGADLEDLGGACFLADIAAMRHETQYARLFRS
jgi:urease accessory protein